VNPLEKTVFPLLDSGCSLTNAYSNQPRHLFFVAHDVGWQMLFSFMAYESQLFEVAFMLRLGRRVDC